jgi:E3 ubiquitin-protein ligase DMA1/2
MLEGKGSSYSQFQCPNCRAFWDLSADVDVEMDDEEESLEGGDGSVNMETGVSAEEVNVQDATANTSAPPTNGDAPLRASALLSRRQATNPDSPEINSVSQAIEVPGRNTSLGATLEPMRTQTPDGERLLNGEGPLTPRNDVGPFILDGSAGRASGRRVVAIPEVTGAGA